MIKAKLINPEATLNNFFEIDSVEFTPGENLTVAIRLFHRQRGIRYVPPAGAALDITFIDTDGAEVVKSASLVDSDDRSMWKVSLSQAETQTLAGTNIELTLDIADDDVTIYKTVIYNSLAKVNLSGDC